MILQSYKLIVLRQDLDRQLSTSGGLLRRKIIDLFTWVGILLVQNQPYTDISRYSNS